LQAISGKYLSAVQVVSLKTTIKVLMCVCRMVKSTRMWAGAYPRL